MKHLDLKHLDLIRAATQTLIAHVDELTALDQAIGDGDHGLNMRRGALAIEAKMPLWQDLSLGDTLKAAGMLCMSTIGGSSGPVFGTLLVTLAKELPPVTDASPTAADLSRALQASIAALTRLGKAEVGQKTLLDVLDPLQRLLADVDPHDRAAAIVQARECALNAAAATAQMDAIKGRASFLGDRALGHVDPGSRSMALIVVAICDGLSA